MRLRLELAGRCTGSAAPALFCLFAASSAPPGRSTGTCRRRHGEGFIVPPHLECSSVSPSSLSSYASPSSISALLTPGSSPCDLIRSRFSSVARPRGGQGKEFLLTRSRRCRRPRSVNGRRTTGGRKMTTKSRPDRRREYLGNPPCNILEERMDTRQSRFYWSNMKWWRLELFARLLVLRPPERVSRHLLAVSAGPLLPDHLRATTT
jgi:hypothetical protein